MTKTPKKDEISDKTSSEEVSKTLLGSLLGGYKDSHYNGIKKKSYDISSGSLLLDEHVKLKSGQIIRMGGPQETGKTSQSLLFLQNYLNTVPKSKGMYINAEAKFGEEIRKRSGMRFTESNNDWDYGSVFVFNTNIFDAICDTLNSLFKQMYESDEHLGVILDSIDCLMLAQSLTKGMTEGKKPAGVNYLTKEFFRRLGHPINSYNGLLMMITQYSSTFQIETYAKTPPSMMDGNQTNSLNHQASYGLYYRPRYQGDYILENQDEKPDPTKNKILGVKAKIDIKKSLTESTGYTIDVPIKKGLIGNQIWVSKEVADIILSYSWAKKSGAWITFDKLQIEGAKEAGFELKEKINGLSQLYDYLEQDKVVFNWFYEKIKTIRS